jgi:hypothetical protein
MIRQGIDDKEERLAAWDQAGRDVPKQARVDWQRRNLGMALEVELVEGVDLGEIRAFANAESGAPGLGEVAAEVRAPVVVRQEYPACRVEMLPEIDELGEVLEDEVRLQVRAVPRQVVRKRVRDER